MKSGSNPVLILWQKVLLDGRISKLAVEFRKKLNVPNNGFVTSEESDNWIEQVKIAGRETERINTINSFIDEAKIIIPHKGILNNTDFHLIMIEFFYFNDILEENLEKV